MKDRRTQTSGQNRKGFVSTHTLSQDALETPVQLQDALDPPRPAQDALAPDSLANTPNYIKPISEIWILILFLYLRPIL